MSTELHGKVFLLTGANGGLGSATALALAEAGATVVLLGRNVRQLERVYDAVRKVGAEPLIYPLDLEGAAPDDFFELATRIESELGRLDGLLHFAANFEGLTPLLNTDPAKLARAMHVNFTSMSWLTQACLPLLAATARDGVAKTRVLVAVDDAERVSHAFWGGYGAAQLARRAWVATVASELGPDSAVEVFGFMPGPMRTMLRSRAYANDADLRTRAPGEVAPQIVRILSSAQPLHGQIARGNAAAAEVSAA